MEGKDNVGLFFLEHLLVANDARRPPVAFPVCRLGANRETKLSSDLAGKAICSTGGSVDNHTPGGEEFEKRANRRGIRPGSGSGDQNAHWLVARERHRDPKLLQVAVAIVGVLNVP